MSTADSTKAHKISPNQKAIELLARAKELVKSQHKGIETLAAALQKPRA
jgi:hypothetical protein